MSSQIINCDDSDNNNNNDWFHLYNYLWWCVWIMMSSQIFNCDGSNNNNNNNNNNDNNNCDNSNDKMLKITIYIVHAFLTICPS